MPNPSTLISFCGLVLILVFSFGTSVLIDTMRQYGNLLKASGSAKRRGS